MRRRREARFLVNPRSSRQTRGGRRPSVCFLLLPFFLRRSFRGNMRHFARQGTGTTTLQFGPTQRKGGKKEGRKEGGRGQWNEPSHPTTVDGRGRTGVDRRWAAAAAAATTEDAFQSPYTTANKLSSGVQEADAAGRREGGREGGNGRK